MKIVFWSPVPGQCNTTSSLLAIASNMTIQEHKCTRILSSNFNNHSIQTAFSGFDQDANVMNAATRYGVDALFRYARATSITKAEVDSAAFNLNPKLSFYPSPSSKDVDYNEKIMCETYPKIIEALDENSDYVFIDTKSGASKLNQLILTSADVIVICLNQNRGSLEKYFSEFNFNSEKIFVLLTDYDREQKFSMKNIRKRFKSLKSSNSAVLPHCSAFSDALNAGKLFNWLVINKECKSSSINYSFVKEMNLVTKKLAKFTSIRMNGGKR